MGEGGGVTLESACLSIVCLALCVSVCVQNISFCQSVSRGIKSHLVTALVFLHALLFWCVQIIYNLDISNIRLSCKDLTLSLGETFKPWVKI